MPRSRPEAILQLGLLRLARHGEGVLVVLALAVHTNVPAILSGYKHSLSNNARTRDRTYRDPFSSGSRKVRVWLLGP